MRESHDNLNFKILSSTPPEPYCPLWQPETRHIINLKINPYSAGINFSRQSLTSADVRLWRLKLIPALYE